MKRVIILFALITGCNFTAQAQSDPNARDLEVLSKWFEGTFDNDSQLWLEGRRDWKGKEEYKHQRNHATHIKINAPALGEHVFYVEEFIDDIDSVITRQRVVSFESEPDSGHIQMKIYFLKEGEQYHLRNNEGTFTHSITEDDLFGLDGCDVVIRREGEQYEGHMRHKACQFGEGDLRRYSVHDIIISKSQYWRIDQTYLVSNDNFHDGNPSPIPFKMRKAAYYKCDVSFYEKAYYMPSDKDTKYTGERIHNQGGSKWFYNPVTEKKHILQIREKEYPFYSSGSDFLMLRFKQEDKLASDVIVTVSPGTKTLSFNMGQSSAFCEKED